MGTTAEIQPPVARVAKIVYVFEVSIDFEEASSLLSGAKREARPDSSASPAEAVTCQLARVTFRRLRASQPTSPSKSNVSSRRVEQTIRFNRQLADYSGQATTNSGVFPGIQALEEEGNRQDLLQL